MSIAKAVISGGRKPFFQRVRRAAEIAALRVASGLTRPAVMSLGILGLAGCCGPTTAISTPATPTRSNISKHKTENVETRMIDSLIVDALVSERKQALQKLAELAKTNISQESKSKIVEAVVVMIKTESEWYAIDEAELKLVVELAKSPRIFPWLKATMINPLVALSKKGPPASADLELIQAFGALAESDVSQEDKADMIHALVNALKTVTMRDRMEEGRWLPLIGFEPAPLDALLSLAESNMSPELKTKMVDLLITTALKDKSEKVRDTAGKTLWHIFRKNISSELKARITANPRIKAMFERRAPKPLKALPVELSYPSDD